MMESRHVAGKWTNRGLGPWEHVLNSTGLPLSALLSRTLGEPSTRGAGKTLHELGCGEAHALLEVQERYPEVDALCVNSRKYAQMCGIAGLTRGARCGNGPTWPDVVTDANNKTHLVVSNASWRATAAFFEIKLPEPPKWPDVRYGDYVTGYTRYSKGSLLPFSSNSSHLILSQQSLNEGKLVPEQFPALAAEVVRVLRGDGAIAVLHLVGVLPALVLAELERANSQPTAVNERVAMMESVRFPFAPTPSATVEQTLDTESGLQVPCYVPVDFAKGLPLSDSTCLDMLSFYAGPCQYQHTTDEGLGLFVSMVKRVCGRDDTQRRTARNCAQWGWTAQVFTDSLTLNASVRASYMKNAYDLSFDFDTKYASVVHRLILNGTQCRVYTAGTNKVIPM